VLAESQLAAHRENLRLFEGIAAQSNATDVPEGVRLALEAGIGHAREYVRFWSEVRDGASPTPHARTRKQKKKPTA
jgi:hypothetical protein